MSENASPLKYQMVIDHLRGNIRAGKYTHKLPSENELSRDLKVSIITVRRALSEMVNSGEIVRIKGNGSFINEKKAFQETAGSAKGDPAIKMAVLVILDYETADDSMLKIIGGAQTALSAAGYSMAIECSNDNAKKETEILDRLMRMNLCGLLIFPVNSSSSVGKMRELDRCGIPYVLLDRSIDRLPASLVTSNNTDGAYRITKYLLDQNHSRMLFAASSPELSSERERMEGFRIALEERGIAWLDDLYIRDAYQEAEQLLSKVRRYEASAIVCVNDRVARVVIEQLRHQGYRIPEDISITGFDDCLIGQSSVPAITSVKQQFDLLGKTAGEMLVRRIEKNESNSIVALPVELSIRDSVKPYDK